MLNAWIEKRKNTPSTIFEDQPIQTLQTETSKPPMQQTCGPTKKLHPWRFLRLMEIYFWVVVSL